MSPMIAFRVSAVVLCMLSLAMACGDSAPHDEGDGGASHDDTDGATEEGDLGGMPTGSECPPNNTLTYESFGQDFMDSYCTRCHSSEVQGPERNGAPADHDFDSLIGILSAAEHIDELAAGGPDSINRIMPPDGDKPSDDERKLLGQWLACELEDGGDAGAMH